jgi:hypothetical protein
MPSYTQTEPTQNYTLPDGKYKIEVEAAETKISQKSSNEYIRCKCRVTLRDGTKGPAVYDNLVFSPKSFWKVDQAREAMGFAVVPNEPCTVEPEDLIGKKATVIIKTDEDSGYNVIDRWISPKELEAAKALIAADGDDIPF